MGSGRWSSSLNFESRCLSVGWWSVYGACLISQEVESFQLPGQTDEHKWAQTCHCCFVFRPEHPVGGAADPFFFVFAGGSLDWLKRPFPYFIIYNRPFHKRLKILYWFIRKISSDSVLSSKNMLTLQVSCWYTQQKCYYSHTHVTVKAFLNLFWTTLASFAWKGLFFNWR